MKQTTFSVLVTVCLMILAADAIYDRFVGRRPQLVYVRGGEMSVTVEGGDLDTIGQIKNGVSIEEFPSSALDVNVRGGKLDYPTDWTGRLIVKPE